MFFFSRVHGVGDKQHGRQARGFQVGDDKSRTARHAYETQLWTSGWRSWLKNAWCLSSLLLFIGHVFKLTYADMVDKLIQQQKLNRCHGCAIQHPSRNQHSCLMMDEDDAWMYYHDEVSTVFTRISAVALINSSPNAALIWGRCLFESLL